MMKGRGLQLLQKVMETVSTAETSSIIASADQALDGQEEKTPMAAPTDEALAVTTSDRQGENTCMVATTDEGSAVVAVSKQISDKQVMVLLQVWYSADEDCIDDSDADPTFSVPDKQRFRPLVYPRRSSSSSSSSSTSSSSFSSSDSSSEDESNRPGPSFQETTTPTNTPSTSLTIDTVPSESEPKLSRKRKCNPANWKSNIAKALRNTGNAYASLTNPTKLINERQIRPPCGDKCKFNFKTKIDETIRQDNI